MPKSEKPKYDLHIRLCTRSKGAHVPRLFYEHWWCWALSVKKSKSDNKHALCENSKQYTWLFGIVWTWIHHIKSLKYPVIENQTSAIEGLKYPVIENQTSAIEGVTTVCYIAVWEFWFDFSIPQMGHAWLRKLLDCEKGVGEFFTLILRWESNKFVCLVKGGGSQKGFGIQNVSIDTVSSLFKNWGKKLKKKNKV